MKSDEAIQAEGMEALIEKLGLVEAERFIMLTRMNRFDYTEWRENQFEDKSLDDLFKEAAASRAKAGKALPPKPRAVKPVKRSSGKSGAGKRLVHA